MKFSIIVAAKDVLPYIERCIRSVISQGYYEYEIIIIDDGSTDGTSEIISRFSNDKRISIITTRGVGLGRARNIGITLAKGEYLLFVDGDDFLSPKCLLELSECIERHKKVSLIMFEWNRVNEREFVLNRETYNKRKLHQGIACWNKCYRRELIYETRFTERSKFEDVGFSLIARLNSKKTVYLNSALYNYRHNPNGITKSNNDLKDEMDVLNGLTEFMQNYPNISFSVKNSIVCILNKHLLSGIVKGKNQDLSSVWLFIRENKLVGNYVSKGVRCALLLVVICFNFSTFLYWIVRLNRALKH